MGAGDGGGLVLGERHFRPSETHCRHAAFCTSSVFTYAPKRAACASSAAGAPDAGGAGRAGASISAAGGVGITGTCTVSITEGALVEAQAASTKAAETAAVLFHCMGNLLFD